MINDRYYNRHFIIMGIAIGVVLIYLIRLFMLQIVDQSGRERADNNAQLRQAIYPTRGLIYDRNGELLVFNKPSYEVTIIPREITRDFDTLGLCTVLQIDTAYFRERMQQLRTQRGYNRYTPQRLLTQLNTEDVAALQEQLYRFEGVGIDKRSLRSYTHTCAAHALGSVGEVNQRDMDRDAYYSAGDYSGRDGFERMYERALRGEKGERVLMRDSRGRIQGSYHDGELDRAARAGENLTITLDIHLQELAEELLGDHAGSVVAIEPSTGEVLALVSHPAWDPNELVGRERSANYTRLSRDESKPLMCRATQAIYPPGSTFKTIQALVCLQQKAITPGTFFPCSGPQSTPIRCTHNHGSPVDLESALEQSCNPYFYYAYKAFLEQPGYQEAYAHQSKRFREQFTLWRDAIMRFGLGARLTDSDIPEQSTGAIPSMQQYDRTYGTTGWKAITVRSNSIGQGEVLVTPLQLANMASAIANEGYYITPHLLKNDTMLSHRHETGIERRHFQVVKRGMHRVMTAGTGRYHNIEALNICGKTGTAQNSHGEDHALFIGFAPMENPQIAIAVVVENAGFGSKWACPIAVKMMKSYVHVE